MDLKKTLDHLKKPDAGISSLGMNNFEGFEKDKNIKLKKEKLEMGKSGLYLEPLQLSMPFNPFDINDERFNSDFKWKSPISNSTTVFTIKAEMRKNPKLKAFICEKAEVDPATYNLDTLDKDGDDKITEDDWKVFGMYRSILHYSASVQRYKYSSFGKFGKKALSKVKLDALGLPVGEKDLGYMLYEMETAMIGEAINRIRKSYEPEGENYGKPDTDMNKAIGNLWKERLVSNPYLLGSIRYIKLPADKDYKVDKEVLEKIKKDKGRALGYYELYGSGNKRDSKKIEEFIGRATDIYFDFIQLGISYPTVDDAEPGAELLESYGRRDMAANPVKSVSAQIPNIEVMFREFRDNTDRFDEIVMLRSVRDYRQVDDDVLISAAKEDLASKRDLITVQIAKTYGSLIKRIDENLSNAIMMQIMESSEPETDEVLTIEAMGQVDDNEKGFGINMTSEGGDEVKLDLDED